MDKEDIRDFRKARSLAHWSWIGILLPLFGWILAGLSLSLTKDLPKHPKIERIRSVAHWSIICSISAFAVYLSLFTLTSYNNYKEKIRYEEQTTIQSMEEQKRQLDAQNSAEEAERITKLNLNNCLDNVNKWYAENSIGYRSNEYWNQLNTMKQQQITECQLRNQ